MKAFLAALVAVIAITIAAPKALETFQFSSAEVYSTDNVRLGEIDSEPEADG